MLATELHRTREWAEARTGLYRFIQSALAPPSAVQHNWLRGDDFRRGLELLTSSFDVPCPEGTLFPARRDDHDSRYLACFEVGVPGPLVPLMASHYNRREPVTATIREHVLFYKRFGARVAAGNLEPADHLRNELAFLIRLDDLLAEGTVEPESLLRARHDFLSRQVTAWVGRAASQAAANHLPPVYCCLLDLLARAAAGDLEWTRFAIEATAEDAE